jgi:elongation factor Ts
MMTIKASQVSELRNRTGAGMMECKKALVEANGDIEAAIEAMRKAGAAKADKKAGRIAAEGVIIIKFSADEKTAIIAEFNCETDFVGRDENFLNFANQAAEQALSSRIIDIDALGKQPIQAGSDQSIEQTRQELVAKIGENIRIRRIKLLSSDFPLTQYRHGNKIGVVVKLDSVNTDLGKDLAMHIAASRPEAISASDIPSEIIEKERDIFTAQAADSGKPADIIAKMVEGRIAKFVNEISLEGQPFVKDPSVSVRDLLNKAKTKVLAFERFEVGEGIEKREDNFAEEVRAQVEGAK